MAPPTAWSPFTQSLFRIDLAVDCMGQMVSTATPVFNTASRL